MGSRTHEATNGTRLYSVRTVANLLDVSQDTVRRLIERQELAVIRIGSAVRITAADLESFIERHR
jgi:excisionase family DNA binding protein